MKFNQCILAFVLILSVTFTQSSQAGVLDWCTAPFRSVASYVWNNCCPITKAHLAQFEADKMKEYQQDRDEDIAQDKTRKQETDVQIKKLKDGYEASHAKADTILERTVALKQSVAKNEAEVSKQAADHQTGIDIVNADIKKLGLEIASVAVARALLQDSLTQIREKTLAHETEVDGGTKEMSQLNDKLAAYEKQAQARDERLQRIREMLQPNTSSKNMLTKNSQSFVVSKKTIRDKY